MSISQQLDLYGQLQELRRTLEQTIIGQPEAIESILGVLERYMANLHDNKRPLGAFLLLGPSGTGKTFLTETVASLLQPSESFIKIDCSEYQLDHEVAKLLGPPPGYVGHETGSLLTKAFKSIKHPENGCILLLDEIEKANPKFFDAWLQVLDAGVMTDSKGNKLDFSRCLVFMTSNIGASNYSTANLGFRTKRGSSASVEASIQRELRKIFRTEFLNRLTGMIFFQPLDAKKMRTILDNMIRDLNTKLAVSSIKVTCSDTLLEKLSCEGFSSEFGAREMRRTLAKIVEAPLAKMIICGDIVDDSFLHLDYVDCHLKAERIGSYPILQDAEDN